MTILSETMRLELAPLNVRVITLVAGGTKSNISDNGPPPESLPPTSPYLAVEKHIAKNVDFKQMPTETFAELVVDDVMRGTTGKVWHGVGSKTIRYAAPLMPQWIFVSLIRSCRFVGR
jgi:1-acylglycerone phosphate reductase